MVHTSSLVQPVPQMAVRSIWGHKLQKNAIPRELQKLDVGALNRIVDNPRLRPVTKTAGVNLGSSRYVFDKYSYVVQSHTATALCDRQFSGLQIIQKPPERLQLFDILQADLNAE